MGPLIVQTAESPKPEIGRSDLGLVFVALRQPEATWPPDPWRTLQSMTTWSGRGVDDETDGDLQMMMLEAVREQHEGTSSLHPIQL